MEYGSGKVTVWGKNQKFLVIIRRLRELFLWFFGVFGG